MRYWFFSLILSLVFLGGFAVLQDIKAEGDVAIQSVLIDGGKAEVLLREQTHELTITTDGDFFLGDVENLSISLENAEVLTRTWLNRAQIKVVVRMSETFPEAIEDSVVPVELLIEDISFSLLMSRLFIVSVAPITAVPGETISMTIMGEGFSNIKDPASSVRFFEEGKNDPILSDISVQDDTTILLRLTVPATAPEKDLWFWDMSVSSSISPTNSKSITITKANVFQTLFVEIATFNINAVQYRPVRVNVGEQIFVQMQGVGFTDFGFASIENEKIQIEFSPAIPSAVIRPLFVSEGELKFFVDIPEDTRGGVRSITVARESRDGTISSKVAPSSFNIWGKKMIVYDADVFLPPPGPPDALFEEFFTVTIVGEQLFDSFSPRGGPFIDFGLDPQNIEYVKTTQFAIVVNLKIDGTEQGTVTGFTITRELQDGTVEVLSVPDSIEFVVGKNVESSVVMQDSFTLDIVRNSETGGSDSPRFNFTLPRGEGEVFQSPEELFETLQDIVKWIFAFVVAISLIFLILAAFQFVTGGGDPQQVSEARMKLLYAGLGIGFVVLGIPAVIRTIVV